MLKAKTNGLALIAIGFALPAVAYVVARIALAADAANGGPPNQGAMVIAYLCVVSSIVVGSLIAAAGLFVLMRSSRKSSKSGESYF